jgi:hypothetical protein
VAHVEHALKLSNVCKGFTWFSSKDVPTKVINKLKRGMLNNINCRHTIALQAAG